MEKHQVMHIFFVNGIANGLKGTLIGATLGLLVTTQINLIIQWLNLPIVNFLPEGILPISIDAAQISQLILMSVGLCILAAIFPAWRALKVKPASALRYE